MAELGILIIILNSLRRNLERRISISRLVIYEHDARLFTSWGTLQPNILLLCLLY